MFWIAMYSVNETISVSQKIVGPFMTEEDALDRATVKFGECEIDEYGRYCDEEGDPVFHIVND